MKILINLKQIIVIIFLTLSLFSCSSTDDDNASRASEYIEVTINGNLTDYNLLINARYVPLPAQTGFNGLFLIESEDTSTNKFSLNFNPTIASEYPVVPPTINAGSIPITNLHIDGVNFDPINSNVQMVITKYDHNVGDDIDINLNGTYQEIGNTTVHTINIDIHIQRS